VNAAGRTDPAVWALHLVPVPGPAVLVVLQLSGELDAPPAVHALVRCPGRPDRCLASLGWCPVGLWRPRSYGAVCRVAIRHPHS
jgi:hypothetical protein